MNVGLNQEICMKYVCYLADSRRKSILLFCVSFLSQLTMEFNITKFSSDSDPIVNFPWLTSSKKLKNGLFYEQNIFDMKILGVGIFKLDIFIIEINALKCPKTPINFANQ